MTVKYKKKPLFSKSDWLQVQAFQLVFKIQRQRDIEPLEALVMAVLETNDTRFKELKVSKKQEMKDLEQWRSGADKPVKITAGRKKPVGVYWRAGRQRWEVRTETKKKRKYFGSFKTKEEALAAYKIIKEKLLPTAPEVFPE